MYTTKLIMRDVLFIFLFVYAPTYSKEAWDTLYHQKYHTTVRNKAVFNNLTVNKCSDMCRKVVENCNIAIYDVMKVNIFKLACLI